MTLGIQHVQHDPFVVVMPEAGKASTQFLDLVTSGVDVVDFDVQVDAYLSGFRFGYALEGEAGKLSRA
ncbi:hypothetical protein BKG60_22880 [Mycobacterium syngnathidarum]|nr:hypothetical protein BKG60_22880 [Mycobacterium syngnathidarum]